MITDDRGDSLPVFSYRNTRFSMISGEESDSKWQTLSVSATSQMFGCSEDKTHYNMTTLLSQMQHLDIDMLHTTWEDVSPALGTGGTSIVSQAVSSPTTAFAFKRYRRDTYPASEWRMYRSVIAEVRVLGSPTIREHPNIVDLEGICWEVDDTLGTCVLVNPVLVFEKAQYGTLADFVILSAEHKFKQWYNIIIGFVDAISALHNCGLVHGDVKPTNILVFLDRDGNPVPKLADFGFSVVGLQNQIHLPISKGWNAPELRSIKETFDLPQAQKTDVFSAGLVILWILFRLDLATSLDVERSATQDLVTERLMERHQASEWSSQVDRAKIEGGFGALVESLLSSLVVLTDITKTCIRNTVGLALKVDPMERASHCGYLLNALREDNNTSSDIAYSSGPLVTGSLCQEFNIATVVFDLSKCDVRVRKDLIRNLHEQVQDQSCSRCARSAAYALAVCATLGYGMSLDLNLASSCLGHAQSTSLSIQSTIDDIANETVYRSPTNKRFIDKHEQGLVPTTSIELAYRRANNVSELIAELQRETDDIERALGPVNYVTLSLKSSLIFLLKTKSELRKAENITISCIQALESATNDQSGGPKNIALWRMALAVLYADAEKHDEALAIQEAVVDTLKTELGMNHAETWNGMELLSHCYARVWRVSDAETIIKDIVHGQEAIYGNQSLAITAALWQLGYCLELQGKYDEARTEYDKVAQIRYRTLGERHPDTQGIKLSLVSVAILLRDYEKARRLALETKEIEELFLDRGTKVSMRYCAILSLFATLYRDMKEYEEAQPYAVETINFALETYGENTVPHLDALDTYISIRRYIGSVQEAIDLQADVIQRSITALGSLHAESIFRRAELGSLYNQARRFDEAEITLMKALQDMSRLDSGADIFRNACLVHLGVALSGLDRPVEAISRYREALDLARTMYGQGHHQTVSDMCSLATELGILGGKLLDQDEFRQAESLYRECLQLRLKALGEENEDTVRAMGNLATTLCALGKPGSEAFDECVKLEEKIVQIRSKILGHNHPDTIDALDDLAGSYRDLGRGAEEAIMHIQSMLLQDQYREPDETSLPCAEPDVDVGTDRPQEITELSQLFAPTRADSSSRTSQTSQLPGGHLPAGGWDQVWSEVNEEIDKQTKTILRQQRKRKTFGVKNTARTRRVRFG